MVFSPGLPVCTIRLFPSIISGSSQPSRRARVTTCLRYLQCVPCSVWCSCFGYPPVWVICNAPSHLEPKDYLKQDFVVLCLFQPSDGGQATFILQVASRTCIIWQLGNMTRNRQVPRLNGGGWGTWQWPGEELLFNTIFDQCLSSCFNHWHLLALSAVLLLRLVQAVPPVWIICTAPSSPLLLILYFEPKLKSRWTQNANYTIVMVICLAQWKGGWFLSRGHCSR